MAQTAISLQLAGRYVAYESPDGGYPLWLWDTRTNRNNHLQPGGTVLSLPAFALSPRGVAAEIVLSSPNGVPPQPVAATIKALTLGTIDYDLDGGQQSDLGNLQLYDCAAGCAPNDVVVSWMHSGAQRYAQVAGSD
jgi:hypothetical protein